MLAFTLIVIVLLWALFKYLKGNLKIFEERGVKYEEPVIIFGNVFKAFIMKESIIDVIDRLCNKFHNEK